MIWKNFNKWFEIVGSGGIDMVNDTIKVMLCTSSFTPDVDNMNFKSDITNEVSGTGYTAGGQALASKAWTRDDANDRAYFDAADVQWASSTITARFAVIYKDTGTPTTSPVIGYFDFEADKSSDAGNFTLEWNASGIFDLKNPTV